MGALIFRRPGVDDAAAITAIDKAGLATGHATFRETPHDWAQFQSSFLTGRGIALVVDDDGEIAGWAGVSPTSSRKVYRGVGEASVYVAADRQGQGVGHQLLAALIALSEREGYWTLVAQIFPENVASIALHHAHSFETLGTRRRLGQMTYGPLAGHWRDVVMLERRSRAVG